MNMSVKPSRKKRNTSIIHLHSDFVVSPYEQDILLLRDALGDWRPGTSSKTGQKHFILPNWISRENFPARGRRMAIYSKRAMYLYHSVSSAFDEGFHWVHSKEWTGKIWSYVDLTEVFRAWRYKVVFGVEAEVPDIQPWQLLVCLMGHGGSVCPTSMDKSSFSFYRYSAFGDEF